MNMKFLVIFCAISLSQACPGVSRAFNETIGHALHSITLEDLRRFNPRTPVENGIPTVNMDLSSAESIVPNAPSVNMGDHFATDAFNIINWVLTHQDTGDDGLGPNWLPQERIVHAFHMKDLYSRIHTAYDKLEEIPDETCKCLLNTQANGVEDRLQWIHDRYKVDTPISLHEWGTQIPKLKSSTDWKEWVKRFSYYYTPEGDRDPAVYLKCAIGHY